MELKGFCLANNMADVKSHTALIQFAKGAAYLIVRLSNETCIRMHYIMHSVIVRDLRFVAHSQVLELTVLAMWFIYANIQFNQKS